jgi:hypothetical protein
MAAWKRLTRHKTNNMVDVNLDQVIYISLDDGHTTIFFNGDRGQTTYVEVTETPDEIHNKAVLRSKTSIV